jgi:hypothetical protein
MQECLANLLGNIGIQRGKIITSERTMAKTYAFREKHYETKLISSYPSRSRFPHGNLWDEGFHLDLICRWDIKLCLTIL